MQYEQQISQRIKTEKRLYERRNQMNIKRGDTVSFGNYKGNTDWLVLVRQDEKILIISKFAIEEKPYHTKRTEVSWETCSLRDWLNSSYISFTFSDAEQARILSTIVVNTDNAEYNTAGGNDTEDKIFLLSTDEVHKYFSSFFDKDTTFADGMTPAAWWLRSPGNARDYAAFVGNVSSVYSYGRQVDYACGAVRPAMWLDISEFLRH